MGVRSYCRLNPRCRSSHSQRLHPEPTPIRLRISQLLQGEDPPTPTGVSTSMTQHLLSTRQRGGIVPIADLLSTEHHDYSSEEIASRCKLASLYRLVDLFRWSQGVFNHITLRLPQIAANGSAVEILINPFGLLYHEITASSLVKVNLDGDVLDRGSTSLGISQAGYVLHSAIHGAREDINCIVHLHTPAVSAVSAMKCGLLPLCQEACVIGPVAYHDYNGILVDAEEKKTLVEDLGNRNVMIGIIAMTLPYETLESLWDRGIENWN